MAQFNELEVTVGANISGLRSGLRQGNRAQRRYAQNTERTFGGLNRRLSRFGTGFGVGVAGRVLGAAGIGLTGAAAVTGIRRLGDEFNRFSDIQRRMLTDGQKRWRAFAGQFALATGQMSVIFEDMLGNIVGARAGRTARDLELRQVLRGFVAQAPIGAVRRGREMQAVTRIAEAQRQIAIRKRIMDIIRQERQAEIDKFRNAAVPALEPVMQRGAEAVLGRGGANVANQVANGAQQGMQRAMNRAAVGDGVLFRPPARDID